MVEKSFARLLQNLANDYYHNYVDMADYRMQRKKILDQIDFEANGRELGSGSPEAGDEPPVLMQTIAFDINQDIDSDPDQSG